MKICFNLIVLTAFSFSLHAQQVSSTKIFTEDIDHFWKAYDSVLKVTDSVMQRDIIQTQYLDKASKGLKSFMALRQHTAARHLQNIHRYPKFWPSVRPKTLDIEHHRTEIESMMKKFSKRYPGFKQPELYFTIGCLNSGGTTSSDQVLIGAEIAASDKTVDASELNSWLQSVFQAQQDIVFLVTHETVHTQQHGSGSSNLLTSCLREGSADFISSLLIKKELSSPYIIYGKANEKMIWEKFALEKDGKDVQNWLYNGGRAKNEPADLGYFMGYTICKSYYKNAKDKKQAFIEIVNLNYNSPTDVKAFFEKSGYNEKWK